MNHWSLVTFVCSLAFLFGATLATPTVAEDTKTRDLERAGPGSAEFDAQVRAVSQESMATVKMTPEEADELETRLVESPGDTAARGKLLRYYFMRRGASPQIAERYCDHALWLIEHEPASPYTHGLMLGSRDGDETIAEARALWEEHLKTHPNDIAVLTNAQFFYMANDWARHVELLERCEALEPAVSKWPRLIAIGSMEHAVATDDQRLWRQSHDAFERALPRMQSDRRYQLPHAAAVALRVEEWDKAETYARELLDKTSEGGEPWFRETAMHAGNIVLGQIGLHEGNLDAAETHLLRASKVSRLTLLKGPNMRLPKALLEAGRRDAVLEYLQACRPMLKHVDLDGWIETIRIGEIPEFRPELLY